MSDLTHFDADGNPHMVDVGGKSVSAREAIATGIVSMKPETLRLIQDHKIEKGDVLQVARLAGIMSSKRVSDLIPLCHPICLDAAEIEFEICSETEIKVVATCRATDRTGVEMEALTSASVTALTIYDMCKSVDRGMTITQIRLEEKSGGKSGHYKRGQN